MHKLKILCSVLFIWTTVLPSYSNGTITTVIVDSVKAAEFNRDYKLVLPVQNYKHMFPFMDSILNPAEMDTSNIFITDVYNDRPYSIKIPRASNGKGLNAVWMSPLNFDSTGFLYFSNFKIINYKYKTGAFKTYSVGTDFSANIDVHGMVNEGDSVYYYVTNSDKKKRVNGRDTLIVDFDFYKWNEKTNKTTLLFSASEIVPDSLLVPQLFEEGSSLYDALDIYHWNWIQKAGPGKLLVNFAFCGFMQVDLRSKSIDWYWGNKGTSFSKITGVGDLSNPYYTHSIQKIFSGPYTGYYTYFENGGVNFYTPDSAVFKPIRSRIFSIDTLTNTLRIIHEKRFDTTRGKVRDIPSMALGSTQVWGNYKLVNLGMLIPMSEMMQLKNKYGIDSAIAYWKRWQHPIVYLFDLAGNEIAHYSFPYGDYCYTAWIKPRVTPSSPHNSPAYSSFKRNKAPRIYLNPVKKQLHVNLIADELIITDAHGDFMKKVMHDDTIYTGDLPEGEYYINVIKGNSKFSKKFIRN